jgi:hypothetical protein
MYPSIDALRFLCEVMGPLEPSIEQYADPLYERARSESAITVGRETTKYLEKRAALQSSYQPFSGVDYQAVVRIRADHIERCTRARFDSYQQAFDEIGRLPTEADLREIANAFKATWEAEIRHSHQALVSFLAVRNAPPGLDLPGDLRGLSAHGHDRVLQEWKIWRGKIALRRSTPDFAARSVVGDSRSVAGATTKPVFISYSWENDSHKKWVLEFALRLRSDGVEIIIDQTHLDLGARSPEFMERSVRDSSRVLVICTETYKRRFDNREGGAGYEGHIITGEIVNEVGRNKFIPVLRSGDWKSAMPTALSGVIGVDLRNDSTQEYRNLVRNLHGVSSAPPIGGPPQWLASSPDSAEPSGMVEAFEASSKRYLEQRKRLVQTDIMKKIWSRPRWCIWIRASDFKPARFQSLEGCREFMLSSHVIVEGRYPWVTADTLEIGDEWIGGEVSRARRTERWVLFRSGQFIHNRAFDDVPELDGRVHVLEILDIVTGAVELASRMADRGVLSPKALIAFDLFGVDGLRLTWPEDALGVRNCVSSSCWCQDDTISVERVLSPEDLKGRSREFALGAALEIYAKFGWSDPPRPRLIEEQNKRLVR